MPINISRVIRGLSIFDKVSGAELDILVGTADPNGSVTANQGSLFLRSNGTLYQNSDGATTWAAFSTGGGSAAEEGFIRAFIGKNAAGAETPDYNGSGVVGTVNTIGNNDNLELAIAKLDVRVGANLTPQVRANNQLVAANTIMQLISALDQAIGNDAQLTSVEYIAAVNTIYQNLSALDAQVKANFDAITMGLTWREVAFLVSDDAGLNAAADGTALSGLLPLSDDDGPTLVIGDFSDGDILLSRNTAGVDKVFAVYDDAGTLRITTATVTQPTTGDVHIVKNDLPDGDGQETSAMYTYNGTDYVKIGDIDWQLATGIDLSSGYAVAGAAAAPAGGDSVETAISKLHKDADDIRTTTGTTRGDTDMGAYTSPIVTDNQSTKQNITDLAAAIEDGGVRVESLNVTTQVVLDSVPLTDADVVHWHVFARGDTDPTQRYSSTIRAMHDGAAFVDADESPFLQDPSNKLDCTFDVDVSGGNLRLLVQVDEAGGGDVTAVRHVTMHLP